MALVIVDFQLLAILGVKRTLFNSQAQLMFLYTNNRTPDHADVLANYNPATYNGASGQPVSWNAPPVLDGVGGGVILADPCQFVPTGTGVMNTVYGYYIVETATSKLVAAERFPHGPYNIGGTLLPLVVTAQWAERSIP